MMTRLFPLLRATAMSLLMILMATLAIAQTRAAPLQPEDAFALSVQQDEDGALILNWQIAENYYLYRDGFRADADGENIPLTLPEGQGYDDPYFGTTQIYRQNVSATLEPQDQPITMSWQGCQQDGICYAPQTVRLDVDGTILPDAPAESGWSPAAADSTTSLTLADDQGMLSGLAQRGGVALVLAGFLGIGLLLSFTPCVFPMVPIVAGMLARQGESLTPQRGLILTGAYVLAMATAFCLLGVAAAWSGANLQMALQSPVAIIAISMLFIVLALSMFGVFQLQMPEAIQRRLGSVSGKRGSVGGAMLLGFTSALIIGPCVTAPLAGALLYIAQTQDVALGGAALFALGLGQGLPLMAVGLFGPRILPRSGAWMDVAKYAFGVIFLGFAIWLAGRILPGPVTLALWAILLVGTGIFIGALDRLEPGVTHARRMASTLGVLLLFAGLLQGFGAALGASDPLRPLSPLAGAEPQAKAQFTSVTTRDQLEQTLADNTGKPVLVYVTADWCVTCRVIERGPLADPAVHAALAGLVPVEVDVSNFNAEAQALMSMLSAAGPPTMIFFDAERREANGTRLIGSMDSAALLASIEKVGA